MASSTMTMAERLQIESGHVVPASELPASGQLRRRFLHGETVTSRQARDEIGGLNGNAFAVVVAQMRQLGFTFETENLDDRGSLSYRLTDPSFRPSSEALDAHKAAGRARQGAKPSSDWITATEAAAILGTRDPDQVGKRYRAGKLTKRRKRDHKHFLYDRAEVEALPKIRTAAALAEPEPEAVAATAEPIIPPSAEAIVRFLAEQGGVSADAHGRAATPIRDHFESLGYTRTTTGAAQIAAEKAGLIERQVAGKRCFRIALTDAGWAWIRQNAEPEPELPSLPEAVAVASAPSHPSGSRVEPNALPALPGLGADVTVYALALNLDGSVTMGLRNGVTSWQVDVVGVAET